MQIDKFINITKDIDIEHLKNNISENDLLLLYWYITNYKNEFTEDQLVALYDFFYQIDDKLKEETDEDEINDIHA